MNATDVTKYGHQTVLKSLDGLPEREWHTPDVCGIWSVKDIIAHLASFELVLVDILRSLLSAGPTPLLDRFIGDRDFNDGSVMERRDKSVAEVLAEYNDAYARAARLLEQVPLDRRRQNGALPWYGAEYDLEDFIAYSFYGHKREHAAQINVFRDRLAK